VIATLAFGNIAQAQSATPLDTLSLEPADATFVATPTPWVNEALTPSFALLLSHDRGVRLSTADEGAARSSATLHAIVGLQVLGRLAMAIELPTTILESFSDETPRNLDDNVQGGFGDVRLLARFEALEAHGGIPGATIGGAVYVPTAVDGAFLGGRTARFAPEIAFGGQPSVISWSTAMTAMLDPSSAREGDSIGSEISVKGAFAARLDRFQLGLESSVALSLDERSLDSLSGWRAEALATARVRVANISLSLAGGPGFLEAPGTPSYRLIAGLGAAYEAANRIENTSARTGRNVGEGNVTAETNDRTPAQSRDSKAPAEPPSKPTVDAVPSPPAKQDPANGTACKPDGGNCLPDADKDGVADADDACPTVAAPRTGPRPGCPAAAQLTAKSIALGEALRFRAGSSELEKESEALLAEVVTILRQNPSIVRLAVDGHTDDRGAEQTNLALSRGRAMAVVRWLNEHGIDARRTEARGFGPRQPIAGNDTEAGRAKNRRVEFVILSQSSAGEAAWIDGTLPSASK
jgi:OmpA-OmpF porin, OOP family